MAGQSAGPLASKLSSATAPAAQTIRDGRSVALAERLRAEWARRISKLRPSDRERWLRSQEGITALGARTCNELLRRIQRERQDVRDMAVSMAWVQAFERGELLPLVPRVGGRRYQYADGRRHAVRLVLSEGRTRIGVNGRPTRRWTPPQAVRDEDELDLMDVLAAAAYDYPESPSGRAIWEIRIRGAVPEGGWRKYRRSMDSGSHRG